MRHKKIGRIYGDLEVVDFLGDKKYLCRCSCGNEIVVKTTELRNDKRRCTTNCGCKKHIVNKDENYFDIIDTDDKAYILGLLASDGNILHKKGTHGFELTLQIGDIKVLEKIKEFLKSDVNIRTYITRGTFPDGSETFTEVARLNIYSMKIAERLVSLGLTPKKSLTIDMDFENIFSEELIGSFFRGLWDGDGTICIYKNNNKDAVVLNLIGNYKFLNHIKKFLNEKWHINTSLHKKHKDSKVYVLSIHQRLSCYKFLEQIYKNNTICIERKYNKYLESKKILENALSKTQSTIPTEV